MKPAQSKAVLTAIKAGDLLAVASNKAGVDPSTVRRWRRRGEEALEAADGTMQRVPRADRAYARFARDCDRELAIVEAALAAKVAQSDDWRAAAFLLERRWPERYAPVQRVSMTGGMRNAAASELLTMLELGISPEAFAEVVACLSGELPAPSALNRPVLTLASSVE